MSLTKRFYKDVTVAAPNNIKSGNAVAVQLDGRDLRSPAGSLLLVPTMPLAEAIADEWRAQGENIEPETMPLFGLAVTVLDRVTPQRSAIITELSAYGANDLLCYRDDQDDLASRQHSHWQPWLDRLANERGIHLETVIGIMPITQTDAVKFRPLIAAFDDWRLGILHRATSLSGSLVLGLGFVDRMIGPMQMFDLAFLDELWQNEKWGIDFEAVDRHEFLRAELGDALRFLNLLTVSEPSGMGA
jgi:chaperone required for assembly of F1-ATPase